MAGKAAEPGKSVLYLGDTALTGAAGYLAGLLTRAAIGFDYLPSDKPLPAKMLTTPRRLLIVSDYPAAGIAPDLGQRIVALVEAGMGLLMIGGWESYHGLGGNHDGTPLAQALPVKIAASDDRVNFDQPALPLVRLDHPTVAGLPWEKRPPTIGGVNHIRPKPRAQVVLELQSFQAKRQSGTFTFTPGRRYPLLVVGSFGQGRTAALATDLAPHWVGGFVDWGKPRVTGQAQGGETVEVGKDYARFVEQLVRWTGNIG